MGFPKIFAQHTIGSQNLTYKDSTLISPRIFPEKTVKIYYIIFIHSFPLPTSSQIMTTNEAQSVTLLAFSARIIVFFVPSNKSDGIYAFSTVNIA